MKKLFAAIGVLAAFGIIHANAQGDVPKRTVLGLEGPAIPNAGFQLEVLGVVPLYDQIEGMAGWNLRTRRVTFKPGGIAPIHPHVKRPTLFYIVSGEVIEHRSDVEGPQIHKKGDAVQIKNGAAHWWINETGTDAIVIATDILSDEQLNAGGRE